MRLKKNSRVSLISARLINEVLNYRKAMWHAIEMLKNSAALPAGNKRGSSGFAIGVSRAWQGTRRISKDI
ncbi:MAG: hypothetical protein U5K27_20290 [Desulfotignum sp.]|nr:hypothetical protein [Desulfotignum sp.]